MRRPFLLWLFLVGVSIVLNGCSTIEHSRQAHNATHWSSSEPLIIPYDVRLHQYEKGNLAVNPSFEEGRGIQNTTENEGRITGWQKMGQNVYWVDRQAADYTAEEVNSGRRAIKIFREKANELDEAEGAISDYIEVIPGNYYFSYHVRLKSITSNKYRLGVQLYDAVVVKVLFFDKDKQPIDPGLLNPVSKSLIDSSNKGYSFSNYWRIDDFPWSEVRGRTYNYPFSEGDIPDRTRYVRLFFGLKGTGAMWVDDVVFRYSKWNFTALERLKPFIDRPLAPEEGIIPTPKNLQKNNDIIFYDPQQPDIQPPIIILPDTPAPADLTAAKTLKEKIEQILNQVLPPNKFDGNRVRIIGKGYASADMLKSKLVFSIGQNGVYQKVQPDLPLAALREKPEGYVIKSVQIGNSQIVFLYGKTPRANFYATATAIQLFETDKAVYHNATVVDYPDFWGRAYVFKGWNNSIELQNDLNSLPRMSLYKLNKAYLGYNQPGPKWYDPDELYRKGIEAAGKLCRQSGVMSLAMMVNPYSHLGFESAAERISDSMINTWSHGSSKSLEMLKNLYKPALNAGAETIMLLADDSVPHTGKNRQHYSLYTTEDKARFITLQNAQAHVINELKNWIDSEYPGTRLEFCPPWYSNEHIDRGDGWAENYFHDLVFQIPQDVAIIWTGPTVRSLSIDMADLYRYRNLIGRWPMIWDNTLYARNLEAANYGGYPTHYPGKVRMCNLFEPFDTYRPKGFQNYSDGRQMYTNGAAYSEIYKIKYATVADYEWNTAGYNPERALWKALVKTYGRVVAEKLLYFNDAYYGAYEKYFRLKTKGSQPEEVATAKSFLSIMRANLKNISAVLPQQTQLLAELQQYLKKQENRIAEITGE